MSIEQKHSPVKDSERQTKQRRRKPKPKTSAEWRTEVKNRARHDDRYTLIQWDLQYSDAYVSLSKSARLILIESLAELRRPSKRQKSKKPTSEAKPKIRQTSIGPLLNDGEFSLPNLYLQQRGITGPATIADARRQLVRVGFWDVVESGSLRDTGRFRYSDRWRSFKKGDKGAYQGPPPGVSLYPQFHNGEK
jgi:hypothetical protein